VLPHPAVQRVMAPIADIAARRTQAHPPPPTPPPPPQRPSHFALVSPAEAHRRAFRELTEAASRAYEAAGRHRATGDDVGAALLVNAAGQVLAQAAAIGEELARLGASP
jgi:hypothetical protein